MEILAVTPRSLAAQAGLHPGDRIVAVNGQTVRDFLDLHLWLGEEVLDLSVERVGTTGVQCTVRIVRDYGRELGLTFPDPRIRLCGNDCPFCFVDQLPPGLRRNLYLRDDDYRFSYLYGHFVTLTNVKENEFTRILEQRLSPLYVSVHALDPAVRAQMIVSKRAGEIRDRIAQLVAGGIVLHTQVVLVPGVNDGDVLRETVFELAASHPGVRSVSVVPVGLTGHRVGLAPVRAFSREEARHVVSTVRRWGRSFRRTLGTSFCYAADEFVLLAGRPIPPATYYEDFEQRENGVGLVRQALMRFEDGLPQDGTLAADGIRRVLILTGESFGPVLQDALPELGRRLPRVELVPVTVENRLFGRPTSVGGLLGGRDLLDAARAHARRGDLVLVPDEAVNADGVFLDELSPEDLSRELGVPVAASWDPLLGDPDLSADFSEEPALALSAGAP